MSTPRTDEQVRFITEQLGTQGGTSLLSDHPYYVLDVMARLCRQLETELSMAESFHAVAVKFHAVAVKERDYEREVNAGLREEIERLRAEVERLRRGKALDKLVAESERLGLYEE